MRRRTMALTIAVIGLTVFAGTPASATPPPPSFNVSCAVGGDTVVSWKHAHVIRLDIDWFNSADALVAIGQFGNHGSKFSTTTPAAVDVGGSVEVLLSFNNGTGAQLQPVSCT